MTAASESPSDIAFDKMLTAAFETCDALTDFYCHMEDVRRNALAGTPLPEMDAIKVSGAVSEAHDKYFAAACEFGDLPSECADCSDKDTCAEAPSPVKVEAKPAASPVRRLH